MITLKNRIFVLLVIFSLSAIGNTLLAQSQNKYSDAEVAHIAVTANMIDVETAKLAKKKSENSDVVDFANTMINDHNAVIDKATKLAKNLGVKPQKNALSKKLMTDAENKRSNLQAKSGESFNKAYISHEVEYHKAVINTIQDVLIPNTSNSQLKDLLEGVLPALKTHLEQAKTIQEELASDDGY